MVCAAKFGAMLALASAAVAAPIARWPGNAVPMNSMFVSKWLDLSYRSTYQSSTGWGGSAARAVDGNSNTDYGANSCTHTGHDYAPWWEIDLGWKIMVTAVRVTNRGNGYGNRLNGLQVLVDGKHCKSGLTFSQGETKEIVCDAPVFGRNVRLVIPGRREYLTLCEVGVKMWFFGSYHEFDNHLEFRQKDPAGTEKPITRKYECQRGAAGFWNNEEDGGRTLCCRTKNTFINRGMTWCMDMQNNDRCMFDNQCDSGYCRNAGSSDGVCSALDPAGTEKHRNDEAQCVSGRAGFWNYEAHDGRTLCCRTERTLNGWGKFWCADMENDDRCMFDDQCNSGYCRNAGSNDGVCSTRPPYLASGAHCDTSASHPRSCDRCRSGHHWIVWNTFCN